MSMNPRAPTVRERVSVVCVFEAKILCFRAVDPTSKEHHYFLPGGAREANENDLDCAVRETMEETGYKVRISPNSRLTRKYPFRWNGQDYDCTTHFYRGYLDEPFRPPGTVQDAAYNLGPVWVPLVELTEKFGGTDQILDAIRFLI